MYKIGNLQTQNDLAGILEIQNSSLLETITGPQEIVNQSFNASQWNTTKNYLKRLNNS